MINKLIFDKPTYSYLTDMAETRFEYSTSALCCSLMLSDWRYESMLTLNIISIQLLLMTSRSLFACFAWGLAGRLFPIKQSETAQAAYSNCLLDDFFVVVHVCFQIVFDAALFICFRWQSSFCTEFVRSWCRRRPDFGAETAGTYLYNTTYICTQTAYIFVVDVKLRLDAGHIVCKCFAVFVELRLFVVFFDEWV